MEFAGYAAAVVMGLSLGLLGGGGSILTVPILVYLFGINPILATAYSLFIVGLTALVGGASYLRRGEVDLKTGITFAIPGFTGVYLVRAFLMPSIPDPVIQVVGFSLSKPVLIMTAFATLMLAASLSMIRGRRQGMAKSDLTAVARVVRIAAQGLVVGVVTGFVGAGGGFLIVPALVLLVGLPMKTAVGTSLVIIATNALIGFTGDVQTQPAIDWMFLLTFSGIAVTGLFAGVRLAGRFSDATLKRGFGYFVLVMGTLIFLDQLRQL